MTIDVTVKIQNLEALIEALIRFTAVLKDKSDETPAEADPEHLFNPEQEAELEPEKPVTLVQVRKVLTAKKNAGKGSECKSLVDKHGGKLSEIDPTLFAELIREAEAL